MLPWLKINRRIFVKLQSINCALTITFLILPCLFYVTPNCRELPEGVDPYIFVPIHQNAGFREYKIHLKRNVIV